MLCFTSVSTAREPLGSFLHVDFIVLAVDATEAPRCSRITTPLASRPTSTYASTVATIASCILHLTPHARISGRHTAYEDRTLSSGHPYITTRISRVAGAALHPGRTSTPTRRHSGSQLACLALTGPIALMPS
jgi:hypothetical protein